MQLRKSLFCEPLSESSKAADVLQTVNNYLSSKTSTGREILVVYVPTERLQCLEKSQDLPLW